MRHEHYYEDEVDVHCTDTDATVRSDVITFVPEQYLEVSVARKFKLNLRYNAQHDCYIGSSSGLEFQAQAPKRIV